MKNERPFRVLVMALSVLLLLGVGGWAGAEEEAAQTPEQAGEQVGVEGTYVRVATNDEGWVVLGYRIANESVGEEWMLLDLGVTVMKGVKSHKIMRDDIKLVTPDHRVISLPTQEDYEKVRGELVPLVNRAARMGDSINYWPAGTDAPCSIQFFAEQGTPRVMLAYDEVELSNNRACVGRVYFQVPGGIQHGLYNLDVKFADSIVKVPMQIMTEDEAKEFTKEWKKALKEEKHKGHDH